MRRRIPTALAFLALAFATTASSAGATPAAFYGVVPQTPLGSGDYQRLEDANAGTVRLILSWPSVQPNASTTNWSGFDQQVGIAADHGIKVLPFIYNSPDWIGGCSSECSTHPPSTGKALGRWKRFIAAAENRYGPGGAFWQNYHGKAKPIRAWQIWNEQNSKTFFTPKPDPKLYAKMLSRASAAIHSGDRKAEVILGGMFGLPGGGKGNHAIAAADYLRKLYAIPGAKRDFSGIALHPYSRSIGFVERQVRLARRELKRAHDSKTGLWVTEIGWASGGKPNPLNVGSRKAQAKRLKSAYSLFERRRRDWNVRLVAWFSFQDSDVSDSFCFFCDKSGLLTESGKRKPSYRAFKRLAGKG